MASLDVFAYRFPDESASLAAFQAVMRQIAGGSAYRLHSPDGTQPPTLVVFTPGDAAQLRAACVAAGGTVTSIDPVLLRDLAERSLRAAQRNITGQRHHEPGTPASKNAPASQADYKPLDDPSKGSR